MTEPTGDVAAATNTLRAFFAAHYRGNEPLLAALDVLAQAAARERGLKRVLATWCDGPDCGAAGGLIYCQRCNPLAPPAPAP